jgi:hypothetical protein
MSDRELLYQILAFAFIDIRTAAYKEKRYKGIFLVADLVHNLPLQLASADSKNGDFSDILSKLKERAKLKKCDAWLDGLIDDLSDR